MPTTAAENATRATWRATKRVGTPPTIERIWEMPRKWTFQMPKLRKWVEERIEGHTLNMFGGTVRISGTVHNDIAPELCQGEDLNRDAYRLEGWLDLENAFDTVIFDPPYSAHQAVVSYGGRGRG